MKYKQIYHLAFVTKRLLWFNFSFDNFFCKSNSKGDYFFLAAEVRMESRIPNGMIFILSDKCKILSSYYLQSVQCEVLSNIYFWIIAVFLLSSDDQVELK